MSYTDAPTPHTPAAQFAHWRQEQEERLSRVEHSGEFVPVHLPIRPGNSAAGFDSSENPSTSYESGYRAYAAWPYYDTLVVAFAVQGAGGNVVSRCQDVTTGAATSEVVTSAATTTITWHWLHGLDTTSYPRVLTRFSFDVRIQAGGGGLQSVIYHPYYCYMAPSSIIEEADSSGGVVIG